MRAAQINPLGLDWRRFVVAEEGGQVIGVGQVKPHGDGSLELASIAVIAERRGQGVGSQIVRALLKQSPGRLYLMCRDGLESFYARFGFRRVSGGEMTPYFRRMHRLANSLPAFARLAVRIIVMRRG